ncbi:MAG: BrnT family toxin [Candidatus Omnitrophota bacterium]
MKITHIEWNENTIWHIAKHGVDPREVEEVCFEGKPFILKSRDYRYFALGQTESGRYLTIIFEYRGTNSAKIITARAMSKAEQKFYKRR